LLSRFTGQLDGPRRSKALITYGNLQVVETRLQSCAHPSTFEAQCVLPRCFCDLLKLQE
jgi:hypothetical protein